MTAEAVDGADPLVAVVAWGLTYLAGRYCSAARRRRWRRYLPALAVVVASGVRAGVVAVEGEPLSLRVLVHGFGAGAVAVLLHSQARELTKPTALDDERPAREGAQR